ncbi:coiled-coil domain-containing protein [Aeoliella mucimassa]|uniref:Chromosome partition protein Smc n=1 Tax=Aeoliella mucimassa TaxID=2527972 RepID=A0A518AMV3_9BACT|nr:hypothetical protein [Aeoliella mucimassa]QDU56059.1 hypothetical protein Pan181_22620 [Aeoliella mucimassa]
MLRISEHHRPGTLLLLAALLLALPHTLWAQDEALTDSKAPTGLTLEQERLGSRFERLEAVAARLAELAEKSEPEHAEQLRRAIKASREKGLAERFGSIVNLLETERLSAAATDQEELKAELELLLQVLLEDPNDSEREAMKRFLKGQIQELGKLIRQQRSLRNQNQEGADAKRLADKQSDVNESADDVQKALEENSEGGSESKSSESQGAEAQSGESQGAQSQGGEAPGSESQGGESQGGESQGGESQGGESQEGESPSGESQAQPPQESNDPIQKAAQRVAEARRAMEQAEKKLRDAKRNEAEAEQREAQRELEAARAELERILRQLREEEMERLLAKLVARFKEMLAKQQSIYEETVTIHEASSQASTRNLMLQTIRLSRREAELVRDAEKALTLLREDGTSIAFPETTEQIAEDMQSVTARLATGSAGPITQTVELDIIAGIQDMIGALEQARDELAQQQGSPPPPGEGGGGSPGESPLVPKLAELRMIRTLQARVYKRTQDLGGLADNPQVKPAELAAELEKLADRQERIFEATRDLNSDANR